MFFSLFLPTSKASYQFVHTLTIILLAVEEARLSIDFFKMQRDV